LTIVIMPLLPLLSMSLLSLSLSVTTMTPTTWMSCAGIQEHENSPKYNDKPENPTHDYAHNRPYGQAADGRCLRWIVRWRLSRRVVRQAYGRISKYVHTHLRREDCREITRRHARGYRLG
jgi:hypothetical protein